MELKTLASRHNLVYNSFTAFLRRNFPELIPSQKKARSGISDKGLIKYGPAIEEIRGGKLDIKSVAQKYGFVYKQFNRFLRRNFPDLLP